ncbi:hypothetical protein OHA04_16290 [Streptomyces sp. NBC_01590]|uniref:hypothetical protein n=1 Tax=Streptomyces sp. NBC_01590 TaxID=2975887 RepID=UPI00386ABF0D
MSNRAAVLLGLFTGAVLVVLVPVGLFALVILLRLVNVPPEPDGPPLVLPYSRLQGTWQDEEGGRIVLAADGTFTATTICGDYSDDVTGDSSGFGLPATMTGTGTWESDVYTEPDRVTGLFTEFAPGHVSGQLTARGTAESAPVDLRRRPRQRRALCAEEGGRTAVSGGGTPIASPK